MSWTSSFEDAEERLLDVSLAATPEQRLEWLEEAQRFALECAMTRPLVKRPADGDPGPDPET
ncbi:MAG: hypothetical protein ACSLFQ_19215 [Thermoanaerobaculia bacterium]